MVQLVEIARQTLEADDFRNGLALQTFRSIENVVLGDGQQGDDGAEKQCEDAGQDCERLAGAGAVLVVCGRHALQSREIGK